jgi:hypothetical protein
VLAARRAQIAEFAEFAHRSRVPSLTDLQALGSGGGITAAVIKAMAAAIIDKPPVAGLTTDLPELTAVLMRALVEPAEPEKLTEAQAECFVSVHGRLVLNGWLVDASGRQPATSLVWPDTQPGQPELVVDAAQPEVEPVVEAAQPEQSELLVDGAQPEQNEPVVDAAQPETASTAGPCALLIAGSARSLAGDRPCLTLDDLMAYARREAFRLSGGIRAARNLEIVVLLDQSLGGGIWVDADPDKGHPVAALAVSVPDPPAGIRFTHVPLAGPVPRLMLSAGRAGQ